MSVLEFLLFSKAIEHYINSLYAESKSPRTIGAYQDNLNLFIKHIGDLPLIKLSALQIREFLAARAKGRSSYTVHQAFRVLHSFLNWCVREGFIEQSPMKNIHAPKLEDKVIVTYSRDDIQNMMASCRQKNFTGSRNRAVISLLIDTGMRESELLNLDLNHIDFRAGVIKIKGKGNKERIVHVNEKARQHLWRYMLIRDAKCPREQIILFLSEEYRPLTRTGLLTTIRRIGKQANVKANIHKFRHTAAIEFLRSGGNLATLQHMLGHTNIATTMKYLTALNADDVISAHKQFSPGDKML